MDIEVQVRKGEHIDKALRKLKKKLDKEGLIRICRDKRYYKKPSEVKREQNKRRKRRQAKQKKS